MTEKEKAIDLVNKFRKYTDGTDSETDRFSPAIEKENAKLCAILAVDEIIQECKDYSYSMGHSSILVNRNYWNQVKKEIHKL